MKTYGDICRLDYLVGTLATAYKGIISSLVMKDFCVNVGNGSAMIKGTIIAMPAGEYWASLLHEGRELSRARLHEGFFEVETAPGVIETAKNLQIDIIQSGRHIGTFLLKKEQAGGTFSSAFELSRELRGVNFKALSAPLENRVGLLQKAEDIIAKILSTKKDWKAFSDEVHRFSDDLFWYEREAYVHWFELLLDCSLKACTRIDLEAWDKAVTNFLSLMELPLERETDIEKLRFFADAWVRALRATPVDLTYRLRHAERILAAIHERLPQIDLASILKSFFHFLREKAATIPTIPATALDALKDVLPSDDLMRLRQYRGHERKKLLQTLADQEKKAGTGEYGQVFDAIHEREYRDLDAAGMAEDFFDSITGAVSVSSAEAISRALFETAPMFTAVNPAAQGTILDHASRIVRRFIDLGKSDIAGSFLRRIEAAPRDFQENFILNIDTARALMQAGDRALVGQYRQMVQQIPIPAPRLSGFSNENWSEIVNPLHLDRLSKFLALLGLGNGAFRSLLVHVICSLYTVGVFIPDDRLFQRAVSSYLNSAAMEHDFLLNYLLLKKLPVYFNEVGASGRLRDDTTEIDSWGNDPVLYFLRKQVHVNASNNNVRLVEHIITSWTYDDPGSLEGLVPDDIVMNAGEGHREPYSFIVRPLFEALGILDAEGLHVERILDLPDESLNTKLRDLQGSSEAKRKVFLLCRIYQEVAGKYSFSSGAIQAPDAPDALLRAVRKVTELHAVILLPEKTRAEENLFFKRHIAFGIPSVLGSYHEQKFDAVGDMIRIDARIETLLEDIITTAESMEGNLSLHDIQQWMGILESMQNLLAIHGLDNFQADELTTIARTNTLRISQIIDLLRIWQGEMTWMVSDLHATFHNEFVRILALLPAEDVPDRLRNLARGNGDFVDKAADILMRDIVSSITGLAELDRMLSVLIRRLQDLLLKDPDNAVAPAEDDRPAPAYFVLGELEDSEAARFGPLLGSKAKNLVYLKNRGLPVPQGVVFSAEHTRGHEEYTSGDRFLALLHQAVAEIENRTGKRYGDPVNPLFLSVRSGSYVSMPGILSSILYCGMTRQTLTGLVDASGDARLGWDSYRRFIEHYGTIVHGLDITLFEEPAAQVMKDRRGGNRENLNENAIKEIVGRYLQEMSGRGKHIPEDPYEQLRESVKAVYRSWFSEKAAQFRRSMAISEHWGTAVTVMEMISGNARDSGASVFFTRNPFTHRSGVYGTTGEVATGDDLVYGKLTHRPLRREQEGASKKSLEETDSELFLMHEELGRKIEQAMRGLSQEVEAAYTTQPDGQRSLYVLQTRRMELHREFTKKFHDVCRMEENLIGRGVGVHGGVLSGVATLSSDVKQIRAARRKQKMPVILLRMSASTDDVSLMPEIDGMITAAGGPTSHAAILAQKFDLTAVVGCSALVIAARERATSTARIGGQTISEGDVISIDGTTGLVYTGTCLLTVDRTRH